MVSYPKPRRRNRPTPGTGRPPVVADRPPQPAHAAAPYDTRGVAAPERGRVIAVFGPPGAGTSSIIRCLTDAASHARTAVLRPDYGELEDQVRGVSAEVIFIDGFPTSDREGNGVHSVQYLYDRRLVFPGSGAIVRVLSDPEVAVRERRASVDGIEGWYHGLPRVEDRIRALSLPYFVIHNEPGEEGLTQAVVDLARRASLVR